MEVSRKMMRACLLKGRRYVKLRSYPGSRLKRFHTFEPRCTRLEYTLTLYRGVFRKRRYLEHVRASTPAAGLSSSSATTKLIQVSPEKAASSRNRNLLTDLDVEPLCTPRPSPHKPLVCDRCIFDCCGKRKWLYQSPRLIVAVGRRGRGIFSDGVL
jgi:hypothetical protein